MLTTCTVCESGVVPSWRVTAPGLAAAERTRQRKVAIYSQADLLTAVSEDDARALRELAPDVPVEIVYNADLDPPPGLGVR
jgi:hypothetical protein